MKQTHAIGKKGLSDKRKFEEQMKQDKRCYNEKKKNGLTPGHRLVTSHKLCAKFPLTWLV